MMGPPPCAMTAPRIKSSCPPTPLNYARVVVQEAVELLVAAVPAAYRPGHVGFDMAGAVHLGTHSSAIAFPLV